jgi:hypothetical protein
VKAASRGFARSNTRAASAGFTAEIDGKGGDADDGRQIS